MRRCQYSRCGMLIAIFATACAMTSRSSPREASPAENAAQELDDKGATGDALTDSHAAPLGFVLESVLRARRIRRGQPTLHFELRNGDTVLSGDRLQVSIRTSRDAHLHVAFCSQQGKDPRYPGLKVFPDSGAIRARAHQTTIAPDPAAEIVLDDKPGQESLYLILSRSELSSSDSELAQVIATARQGNQSVDCGPSFRDKVSGPRKDSSGAGARSGKSSRARRPAASTTGARRSQRTELSEEDPIVEIQRGGDVVWNNGVPMGVDADPDGIVILRYGLTHVAAL